jgi:hypothetical protein
MIIIEVIYDIRYLICEENDIGSKSTKLQRTNPSFLPLGATAQGELWPPE